MTTKEDIRHEILMQLASDETFQLIASDAMKYPSSMSAMDRIGASMQAADLSKIEDSKIAALRGKLRAARLMLELLNAVPES